MIDRREMWDAGTYTHHYSTRHRVNTRGWLLKKERGSYSRKKGASLLQGNFKNPEGGDKSLGTYTPVTRALCFIRNLGFLGDLLRNDA